MDGRRGRSLGLERTAFGALGQDGGGAERLDSGALSAVGGFRVDLRDYGDGELLPLLRREVLPAGEGSELEGFVGRVSVGAEVFAAAASEVLLGAVEPPALESLSFGQRLDAVDARPVLEAFHQALFDAVAEDVAEPRDLRLGLVADLDRLIPPPEDLLPPAGESADLASHLGVEVVHEARELPGVVDLQNEVKVIRREKEGNDPHWISALGPGEGSQEDGIEGRPGPKEEAALERPASYLDQGARVWDEADSSTHAQQ
jgi:hypothetical protein